MCLNEALWWKLYHPYWTPDLDDFDWHNFFVNPGLVLFSTYLTKFPQSFFELTLTRGTKPRSLSHPIHPNIEENDTFYRKMTYRVLSELLSDNNYYRWTPLGVASQPNSLYGLNSKLLTCLLTFNWSSQSDHLSTSDELFWMPN